METNWRGNTPSHSGTSDSTDGALKPAVERIAATALAGTPIGSPKRATLGLPTRVAGHSRENCGDVKETTGNFNEDYAE
jgi:hypothetical protein